jgi:hypothetical protein
MQFSHFDDLDPTSTLPTEVYFSNYQVMGGISVPFTRSTVTNGSTTSDFTVTSIAFNTGLSDTLFSATCGE